MKSVISSANRLARTNGEMTVSISLMVMLNNTKPRTAACGAPFSSLLLLRVFHQVLSNIFENYFEIRKNFIQNFVNSIFSNFF